MAGQFSIVVNGEEVGTLDFDSLTEVVLMGQTGAQYYRAADPENDRSSLVVEGENVKLKSGGKAEWKKPPEEPAPEVEEQKAAGPVEKEEHSDKTSKR